MIIKSAELETVCGITSILPDNALREMAFAGRSNVGKSSLINTLLGRKNLARTSSSPGKTQTINFYRIVASDKTAAQVREGAEALVCSFYLVDLPGYGYANADIRTKTKWGELIERYLKTSKQLSVIFLLIDVRRGPGEHDRMMYDWIKNAGFSPVIIATKIDKIKRSQQKKQLRAIEEALADTDRVPVIPFSSVTGEGRDRIWELMVKENTDYGKRT